MKPKFALWALVAMLVCVPVGAVIAVAAGVDASTVATWVVPALVGMAVTVGQVTARRDGQRYGVPAAAVVLYERTLAFVNSSGYADSSTGSGQNRFAGIVVTEVDNSAGSAGDLKVDLWRTGQFLLTGSGFTQADVGRDAYATDNYTISDAPSASGVRVGKIVEYVSATQVWVELDVPLFPVSTVKTVTADFTVGVGETGKTFSSAGASGTITGSLPAAVPGLRYRFRVGAAQQLRIDPNGTETISLPSTGVPGAAGKYLVADAIGETVDIECVVAGTWTVFGFTGTWTAEP